VAVVDVQPANGRTFGALQLAGDETILPAGVGLQRQARIHPQLSLRAEPVRCLHQSNQKSGADGADRGNLAQQLRRAVFFPFG
jgi:hypothetical protein